MIGKVRSLVYRTGLVKVRQLPAYVVSVGNISLGGTGKSPFALLLAEKAIQAGLRTAVLTRGYGRKSTALAIVGPHQALPSAELIGDEPRMIKQRVPGISLLVHPDRGRLALDHWRELGSPELVILDDAFQHWRLARDRDVVMVDAQENLHGRTLPFGRLRESAQALGRADLVVVTRADALDGQQKKNLTAELRGALEPRSYAPWKTKFVTQPAIAWADYEFAEFVDFQGQAVAGPQDRECIMVSGIAKPEGFRALARKLGVKIREEFFFPDHHRLTGGERQRISDSLARLSHGMLLITEKDWARWQEELAGFTGLVLRVKLRFADANPVDQFMREVVAEAKRCSISG